MFPLTFHAKQNILWLGSIVNKTLDNQYLFACFDDDIPNYFKFFFYKISNKLSYNSIFVTYLKILAIFISELYIRNTLSVNIFQRYSNVVH